MSLVLGIYQKKLAYFQEQEAITSNPEQKFELREKIEEYQQKIREIEKEEENQRNLKKEQAIRETEAIKEESSRLRQFRERVQECLEDHQLTVAEKVMLKLRRKTLGLTEEEAEKIIAEEQAPIIQARDNYQELLRELIQEGCYPFDAAIQKDLEKFKKENQLQNWEITEIEQPILRKAEEEYQQREFEKSSSHLLLKS